MIVLSETTDNLQAVLAGAITTNQLNCFASWRDVTTTDYTPGRSVINTNSTTDVNVVAAPAASTQRVVDFISIFNADTVAAIVTVKFDANGTEYPLVKMTLAAGETLEYVDGSGWSVKSTGYKQTLYVLLHNDASANFAMTNATNAERFALNTTRHIQMVDLAGYTQARLIAHVLVVSASANTPLLRLRYYTSLNATFANYLQLGASGHVEVSVVTGTVNTWQDSGWLDLASGAKADGVAIAMCEIGGDGAADPAVGYTVAMFR